MVRHAHRLSLHKRTTWIDWCVCLLFPYFDEGADESETFGEMKVSKPHAVFP